MPGAPSAGEGPGLLGECFYFFFPWLWDCPVPVLGRPTSALGGHQGGLGEETLALDGETQGWPSYLSP